MTVEASYKSASLFVHDSEAEIFQKYNYPTYDLYVKLHEMFGHGTGKIIQEGESDFDMAHLPIDPLTGKCISSWYKQGQTFTGQFGELAATLDECRAELVSAYLMTDSELLASYGFTDKTDITSRNGTLRLSSAHP